jgi:hypothetical protein
MQHKKVMGLLTEAGVPVRSTVWAVTVHCTRVQHGARFCNGPKANFLGQGQLLNGG